MGRKYRQMSDITKKKISQAHKNKKHSQATKDLISKSMKEYWKSVPDNPFSNH